MPTASSSVPRSRGSAAVRGPATAIDAVRATPSRGVCLLVAAPGYGRTTTVHRALEGVPGRVAWVDVDERDAAPERLWRRIAVAAAAAWDRPTRAPDPSCDDLDLLVAALARRSGQAPLWIVVDDVHRGLGPGSDVVRALVLLAENLPEEVRLVASSRCDLPELTGSRARVAVVDEAMLAIGPDDLPAALGRDDVDPRTAAEIDVVARGWPAAVSLLRDASDVAVAGLADWLRTAGSERLLGDWWASLHEEDRAFLLGTSVLDRLSAGACDSVLERDDAGPRLDALVRSHTFLLPLPVAGGDRCWERHPLLTAFLRRRPAAADVTRLRHERAAAWSQARHDVDGMIAHLTALGRVDDAAALVRRHEDAMFESGQLDRVRGWYEALPAGAWESEADVWLRRGWEALYGGDVASARARLAGLRTSIDRLPAGSRTRRLAGEADLLGAAVALGEGDARSAADLAAAAMARIDDDGSNAAVFAPVLRARCLLWVGRLDEAAALLDTARRRAEAGTVVRSAALLEVEASLDLAVGRVRRAFRRVDEAQAAVGPTGPGPFWGLDSGVVRGLAMVDLGDVEAARAALSAAAARAVREDHVGYRVLTHLGLARTDLSVGDLPAAGAHLAELRDLLTARAPDGGLRPHLWDAEARLRLMAGDAVRAERAIDRLPDATSSRLLRVRLGQLRRPGSGRGVLERLRPDTVRAVVERDVLLFCAAADDDPAAASAALLRAADLATDEGCNLALLGTPEPLLHQARQVALRTGHDALGELVALAARRPSGTGGPAGLSRGELHLLALLAGRESNQELAAQLSVSVNTVKTRLRRLYAKLGVASRNEAVKAGRALGLIG